MGHGTLDQIMFQAIAGCSDIQIDHPVGVPAPLPSDRREEAALRRGQASVNTSKTQTDRSCTWDVLV